MSPPFQEQNRPVRSGLRTLGFVLLPLGAIFALVGFVDFFGAFGGGGFPTKFWCLFVGMPMVGIGIAFLKAGYIGAIGKYVAGETVPVATESAKFVVNELRPNIRDVAGDLRGVLNPETQDPLERMKQLEEMKRQGFITAEEFEAKRAEIVREI